MTAPASQKSLDQKIANIRANPHSAKDFILADAKDADMGQGLAATGKDAMTGKPRSLAEYRQQMRSIVKQGLVDIMLMSASSSEVLTIDERLFDNSNNHTRRAGQRCDGYVRAERRGKRDRAFSPFRTATIEQIQSGRVNPTDRERKLGADLGLYSVTPNNDVELDLVTVETYKQFRIEAEMKGFRHFLEVFDPNVPGAVRPENVGVFVNDFIARTLAGVPRAARPLFLKMVYHGPEAVQRLVDYDPTLIVGVLGGSSGTTFDAFNLLEQARKYGARAALFGRKINHSEHPLTFIQYLHAIANGKISAAEAVKAFHADLERMKIKPYRTLKDDSQETQPISR